MRRKSRAQKARDQAFLEGMRERIYELREQAGMTVYELGKASGLHFDTISKIELGVRKVPSMVTLFRIAEGLNVELDAIVTSGQTGASFETARLIHFLERQPPEARRATFRFLQDLSAATRAPKKAQKKRR